MILSPLFWLALLLGVPAYWAAPARLRPGLLAGLSVAVVAHLAPWVALSLLVWTVSFYYLLRRESTQRVAAWAFGLGILGALFAFKYAAPLGLVSGVMVPIGLSFFTFKLLHYGIDVRRGKMREHTLFELLSWVFLFPAFTAGPIERLDHFLENREERLSRQALAEGLTRVAHGLIKKLLIAEMGLRYLLKSNTADRLILRLDALTPLEAWTFAVLSFLWLYMDFSGYSDLAIGASRLFGVRLAENFDWPIVARTPAEFWRRWHISLSAWCQNYVYLPVLLRSRSPYVAATLTFTVMGLWHAGSLPWLAWGLWHALGVILTTLWQRIARQRGWLWALYGTWSYLTVPLTFAWVCIGHLVTTVHGVGTLTDALHLVGRLFGV